MTQERLTDAASDAEDKAADLTSRAGEVASDIKDRAADLGAQAAAKADKALDATGERLTSVAQTIRDKAPAEGRVADVATATADALERGGEYLQLADLNDVRADAERLIRQYPLQSLLVGVGIGYLLARATRK